MERYENLLATSEMLKEMEDKPRMKLDLSGAKSKSQRELKEPNENNYEDLDDLGKITDRKSLVSIKFGLSVKQKLSNGYVGSKLGHER